MKLIINYMLRTVRKSKIKAVIVVFSFTIMTALLLVNLLTLFSGADLYRNNNQLKYGTADILCQNKDSLLFIDGEELILNDKSQIKNSVNVSKFVANFETKNRNKRVIIYSADLEELADMKLIEKCPGLNNEKLQLIVSESFLNNYNYKNGDIIELNYASQNCEAELVQISDNTGLLSQSSFFDQGIASTSVFEKLSQIDYQYNTIYYDIENTDTKNEVLNHLNQDNPNYVFSSLIDENSEKREVSNLNTILSIVLILVIILSTIVIWALYNHIFESHISVIGTFRSIGISKFKISLIMLSETIFYGLMGGIVGTVTGTFLYRYLIDVLIGPSDIIIRNNFTLMILSFIFPVIYSILLTSLLLIGIFNRPIINVIRNSKSRIIAYKPGKYIILSLLLVVGGGSVVFGYGLISVAGYAIILICIVTMFPFMIVCINKSIGKLCGKNNRIGYALSSIAYNKLIIRSITVTMVSIGLIIPVFSAKNSMHDIFYFYKNNYNFDVILGTNDNEINIDKLNSLSSVKNSLNLWYSKNCKLIFDNYEIEFSAGVLGRDVDDNFDDFLHNSIEIDNDLIQKLDNSDGIILDESFKDKSNAKTGDVIRLKTEKDEYSFTIIGFCNSYRFNTASNIAIIDLEKYKDCITEKIDTVYFQSNTTVQELFNELDDSLMDYNVVLKDINDFFGKQAQSNDSILKLISGVMYINLIICFIGIVNNFLTDFINRKKEFAVLISTSMSHAQLMRINAVQMTFVAGYSIVGGLLFSYCSTKLLDKIVVIYRLISTGMNYPVSDSLKIFVIALLLFIMMVMIPYFIIKKLDVYFYLRRE